MKKTVASIEEEIFNEEKKYRDILKELESLEENDIVQEYIRKMNQYEIIKRNISKLKRNFHLAQMEECNHLFVIVPTKEDDKLLAGEVGLCCLQCGLTNTRSIDSDVNYDTMVKLLHTTLHHGRIVYDKEIKDLDFAIKVFEKSLCKNMSNNDLMVLLKEQIESHEMDLNNKHVKSL